MNDFMKNWKELIAAFEAKNYVEFAEKVGQLITSIAQILKMFNGLNEAQMMAKVEQLKVENHPLFATATTAEDANFGIQDVVAIVAVIKAVVELFGKWFKK